MTSTPAALRSATLRSISANRYGGMASMRRAVRMSWHSFCVEVRQPAGKVAAYRSPPCAGAGPGPGPGWIGGGGGLASVGPCSADSQLAVPDPGQAAFGAPALGAVDEFDDLAALGVGDGVPAGHGVADVALLAGPGDEPHQLGLGREPLAVAGGVAEQEPSQLRLRVERPVLGETVIEDENVIHVDRPFCTVCGSLRHGPANQHEARSRAGAGPPWGPEHREPGAPGGRGPGHRGAGA